MARFFAQALPNAPSCHFSAFPQRACAQGTRQSKQKLGMWRALGQGMWRALGQGMWRALGQARYIYIIYIYTYINIYIYLDIYIWLLLEKGGGGFVRIQ